MIPLTISSPAGEGLLCFALNSYKTPLFFINFLHCCYLLDDGLAQEFGFNDFHFRAVLEDVHDQFAAVVKGDSELVVAVI